jgi:hypothetical protein
MVNAGIALTEAANFALLYYSSSAGSILRLDANLRHKLPFFSNAVPWGLNIFAGAGGPGDSDRRGEAVSYLLHGAVTRSLQQAGQWLTSSALRC